MAKDRDVSWLVHMGTKNVERLRINRQSLPRLSLRYEEASGQVFPNVVEIFGHSGVDMNTSRLAFALTNFSLALSFVHLSPGRPH